MMLLSELRQDRWISTGILVAYPGCPGIPHVCRLRRMREVKIDEYHNRILGLAQS